MAAHRLGSRLTHPSVRRSADRVSFARQCRGSCRGGGGTPHAKYMLIDRVGPTQARHVVIQTSMNLTRMAYQGQWNQATGHAFGCGLWRLPEGLQASEAGRKGHDALPHGGTWERGQLLLPTAPSHCGRGSRDAGPERCAVHRRQSRGDRKGRTKIRIVQYAMHGTRGIWIAKRLRKLQNAGCNIAIIYSVTSRPVREILRSRRGGGPIPMRQSVLLDRWGWVSGYNHGKWMTITGAWGSSKADHLTLQRLGQLVQRSVQPTTSRCSSSGTSPPRERTTSPSPRHGASARRVRRAVRWAGASGPGKRLEQANRRVVAVQ